jgi:hypothetical protein
VVRFEYRPERRDRVHEMFATHSEAEIAAVVHAIQASGDTLGSHVKRMRGCNFVGPDYETAESDSQA